MSEPVQTTIHLLRHGEVHNPTKVLYGRLPGFRLSERGLEQAEVAARFLAGRDIVAVIASPLERAQQTAGPIAAAYGLEIQTDPRIIESANQFEGGVVEPGPGILRHPAALVQAAQPLHSRRGASPTRRWQRGCWQPSRTHARSGARTRGGAGQPPASGLRDAARSGGPPDVAPARSSPVCAGLGVLACLRINISR